MPSSSREGGTQGSRIPSVAAGRTHPPVGMGLSKGLSLVQAALEVSSEAPGLG